MARKRDLHPSFWQSASMAEMTLEARYLFLALISFADDWGCGPAHPGLLKGQVFAVDGRVTARRVSELLAELEQQHCIFRYTRESKVFYQIIKWEAYQSMNRRYRSEVPIPDSSEWPEGHERARHASWQARLAFDARMRGAAPPQSVPPAQRTPQARPAHVSRTADAHPAQCEGTPDTRARMSDSGSVPDSDAGGEGPPPLSPSPAPCEKSPPSSAADKPPQPPGPAPRQARSRSPAGCSWCLHPTDVADESIAGPQRLMQVYHDAYREQHGECPVAVDADWAALKRLLRGKTCERLAAVIRHGVSSEDPLIVRNGHRLAIILSNYQGIAEALDGGETHGVYGANRRPSKRVTPAPPESFGAGGATEF